MKEAGDIANNLQNIQIIYSQYINCIIMQSPSSMAPTYHHFSRSSLALIEIVSYIYNNIKFHDWYREYILTSTLKAQNITKVKTENGIVGNNAADFLFFFFFFLRG